MTGLPVDATWRLIDQLRAESDLLHRREGLIIGSLLAGNHGATLFGKRVEFELRWPDGLPFGWTEGQLRRHGAEMFIKAGGDPSAVEPLDDQDGEREQAADSVEHGGPPGVKAANAALQS